MLSDMFHGICFSLTSPFSDTHINTLTECYSKDVCMCMCACVCACMCVCMCVCMYVCVCVCTCVCVYTVHVQAHVSVLVKVRDIDRLTERKRQLYKSIQVLTPKQI